MNKALLIVTAILESMTGLALIMQPAIVARLLLGAELSGAGLSLGRLAGFGLLSLGVACWPLREPAFPALPAMLIYNLLAAAYLGYLQLAGALVGKFLLPAVLLHALLTVLLAGAWFKCQRIAG